MANQAGNSSGDSRAIVHLNIGGTLFHTSWSTLRSVMGTRLYDLDASSAEWNSDKGEFFFDRDPSLFALILAVCRTGELHVPNYVCAATMQRELTFWNIPETFLCNCCWKHKDQERGSMQREVEGVVADRSPSHLQQLRAAFCGPRAGWLDNARWSLWSMLHNPGVSLTSKIWTCVYVFIAILNISTLFLQTSPTHRSPINKTHGDSVDAKFCKPGVAMWLCESSITLTGLLTTYPHAWLQGLTLVCLLFFSLDFLLRLAGSRNVAEWFGCWLNWLDMGILGMEWIGLILTNLQPVSLLCVLGEALRLPSYLRVFRLCWLLGQSDELRLLKLCLKACALDLLKLLILGLAVNTGFAILVYLVDIAEPYHTTNLPECLWWAVITTTTVGYGDILPMSYQGRVVGWMCASTGVLFIALPVAVIAVKFSEYHELYREKMALIRRQRMDSGKQGLTQKSGMVELKRIN